MYDEPLWTLLSTNHLRGDQTLTRSDDREKEQAFKIAKTACRGTLIKFVDEIARQPCIYISAAE